jgi:hypothetical protein
MKSPLGIALVASPFDWLFAKGTLASCRYFMPDHPITLLVDGDIDTRAAEQTYRINVLSRDSIGDEELRRSSFGWGLTKMLLFWYAPTETFLYLDSDTVLWGDLSSKLNFEGVDYVPSMVKTGAASDADTTLWYFEIPFVEENFPDFDWRKAAGQFFCTGTFASRRNAFELDEYKRILRLNEKHPGQFKFGEMGFLNLMVFRAAQKGALRVQPRDFQIIFPDHTQEALRRRFRFDAQGRPIVQEGDEQVLHMPDKKPLMDHPQCYSEPMTFFRRQYLSDTEGLTGEAATERLRQEDATYHRLRAQFLQREKWKKIARLLRGHPGQWRRLFRQR